MIRIDLVKLGNHWYPNIKHKDPKSLQLDPKFERYLNSKNTLQWYTPAIYIYEVTSFLPDEGLVEFDESEILRYVTTDEDFDFNIRIGEHTFKMSRALYTVLEENFNLEMCKNLYKIEIW